MLSHLPIPPEGKAGWPWTTDHEPNHVPTQLDKVRWPKISIVTPSYNQGGFIEETIRSVLLQGYPNLEYMVVDGGSSDSTMAILQKYGHLLTHWSSEPDSGQSDAINKGFSRCTGQILAYLNSDDFYAPGALFAVAGRWLRAGSPALALMSGDVENIAEAGVSRPERFRAHRLGTLEDWLYEGCLLHQPGTFWTRRTWRRFGPLPPQLHYVMDRYFFTKIAIARSTRFIPINSLMACFRFHADSKTVSKAGEFAREWQKALQVLKREVGILGRFRIRLVEWRRMNLKVVGSVFSEPDVGIARQRMLFHVATNPTSILLRPVSGAVRRLLFQRQRS